MCIGLTMNRVSQCGVFVTSPSCPLPQPPFSAHIPLRRFVDLPPANSARWRGHIVHRRHILVARRRPGRAFPRHPDLCVSTRSLPVFHAELLHPIQGSRSTVKWNKSRFTASSFNRAATTLASRPVQVRSSAPTSMEAGQPMSVLHRPEHAKCRLVRLSFEQLVHLAPASLARLDSLAAPR